MRSISIKDYYYYYYSISFPLKKKKEYFLPQKGGTYQREGAYLRGGCLIEDLRYLLYLIYRPESLPVEVYFFLLLLWALVYRLSYVYMFKLFISICPP